MNNELFIGGDSYGANAVGRGARAVQRNVSIGRSDEDRLTAALDALRTLVDENSGRIPEVSRVKKDIESLDNDVHDTDPDPERLQDTIKRIVARVAMVGTVATAVNNVRDLIESAFTSH
jgi:hypothetical protein